MDAVGFCNRFKPYPDVGQYLHVNIISAVRSKLSIGEVPDSRGETDTYHVRFRARVTSRLVALLELQTSFDKHGLVTLHSGWSPRDKAITRSGAVNGTLGTARDALGTVAKMRIPRDYRPWDGGTAVHPKPPPSSYSAARPLLSPATDSQIQAIRSNPNPKHLSHLLNSLTDRCRFYDAFFTDLCEKFTHFL